MAFKSSLQFSIIIPTHNRRAFLEIAVSSVLKQSDADFELIVVDDGSTDETKDYIQTIHDPRFVYCYQNNQGVSKARNAGLKQARGQWIAFLDSDDQWTPQKLEITRQYIEKFPSISIFYTEEVWYRNGAILNQKKKHKNPDGHVYIQALPLCCMSISTAVINRTVFEAIGIFDKDFVACEDYDFWLRATHRYEVKLIPEALTLKDGGRPDQLSSSIWGLDRFRIKALSKMLKSGQLSKKDYAATYQEILKKSRVYIAGAKKRGKIEEVRKMVSDLNRFK